MSQPNDLVESGKLTQRELLILMADRQEAMNKNVEKLGADYVDLHVRVAKLETRMQVVAAAWSIGSAIVTLLVTLITLYKK